jgi:hypothetical protein
MEVGVVRARTPMIIVVDMHVVLVYPCSCPQPHMFEVHTQGRIFLLSAPSADEMQSWVGMLETLKQYNKSAMLHRQANLRVRRALHRHVNLRGRG